jgi:hypothetical protein
MSPERKARLEALPGWSWNAFEDDWEKGFRYLKEFVDREGHTKGIHSFRTSDGYPLGQWVSGLRVNRDVITSERKARLEALPGWTWTPFSTAWEKGYLYLKDFSEQEGSVSGLRNYKTPDGFPLGSWVGTQRRNKNTMLEERRELLEALPGWSWEVFSDRWKEWFHYLGEFVDHEEHAKVPSGFKTEDGSSLGQWVSDQRKKINNISPELKVLLETLPGWSWDVIPEQQWDEGFRHIKDFSEREGHAKPSSDYKSTDGYSVGSWVRNQRNKKENMSPERKAKLEGLPGWSWDTLEDAWKESFNHLKGFSDIEGHSLVPLRFKTEDGFPIGSWVSTQRKRKDKMSPERVALLEALPGWVWRVK